MKSLCEILWKGVLEPLTHVCTDLKISKESNVLIQVIVMRQYVWFALKTTQDHSLNNMLSPVVLRIMIPDRDVNFLAVVRFQRGLT